MSLNLMMNDDDELRPRNTVFGVGGAGGNAVNNMIEKQLDGVTFVVANTDAQALRRTPDAVLRGWRPDTAPTPAPAATRSATR